MRVTKEMAAAGMKKYEQIFSSLGRLPPTGPVEIFEAMRGAAPDLWIKVNADTLPKDVRTRPVYTEHGWRKGRYVSKENAAGKRNHGWYLDGSSTSCHDGYVTHFMEPLEPPKELK